MSLENDLISVVIPVYNVEKYLTKCIESVRNQTYHNLQIILVDDGSTDSSGIICDQYSNIDNRIQCLHKINGGLSDARNAGIARANGKYISFIDSDDYIDKYYFEILHTAAIEEKADISISNYEKYYENDVPNIENINTNMSRIVMTKNQGLESLFDDRYKYQFTMACGKIFGKTVLEGFRFPVGRNYEDSATAHILISRADKIVYTDRKQYFYLTRTTSITKSDRYLKNDVILAMIDRVEWFAENGYSALEKKAKVQYVLTMMGVYARLTDSYASKVMKKKLYGDVKEYVKQNKYIKYTNVKIYMQIVMFLIIPSLYSVIVRKK